MGDAPPPRVSPHLWPPSLLLSETSSSCKGSRGHSASHWKSRDPHSGASGAQGLGVEPSSCSVAAHPQPSRLKLRPWSLLAWSGPREAPWLTSSYRPMGPSGSLSPSPGGLSLALLQVTTQWPLTLTSASVSNRNSRTSGVQTTPTCRGLRPVHPLSSPGLPTLQGQGYPRLTRMLPKIQPPPPPTHTVTSSSRLTPVAGGHPLTR